MEAYTNCWRGWGHGSGRPSLKISACSVTGSSQELFQKLSWWPQPALKQTLFPKPLPISSTLRAPTHTASWASPITAATIHASSAPRFAWNYLWRVMAFPPASLPDLTLGPHTDRLKSRTDGEGSSGKCGTEEPGRGQQRRGFDCRQPFVLPFTIWAVMQILWRVVTGITEIQCYNNKN